MRQRAARESLVAYRLPLTGGSVPACPGHTTCARQQSTTARAIRAPAADARAI